MCDTLCACPCNERVCWRLVCVTHCICDTRCAVLAGNGSAGGAGDSLHLSEDQRRRSVAARSNWHVTYTLLHNPDIRVTRKGYVQMLRQARQLGISVPVSDRQADVNFEQLQQNIADARDRLNPSSKKKKNDAYVVEEDNPVGDDLNEVVTVGGGGKESEQGDLEFERQTSSSAFA